MEFSYQRKNNICIIICDGLPTSNPSKKELMLKLSHLGYSSIAPRYLGTWESYGNFLDHSPSQDINDLIDYISTNTLKDIYSGIEYDFSSMKYILLGSSFGGAVALNTLSKSEKVCYTILLSPLLNISQHNKLNKEQSLFELEKFIHNAFGNAYRFSPKDRKIFCGGQLFDNDPKQIIQHNQKISIIYDKSDKDISHLTIEEFCKSCGIKNNTIVNGYKHISYSKIDENIINIIDNEIKQHHSLSCGLIPINKKNNKILIVQDNENNWGFPKGLQEENESRIDTCKRECFEEIGVVDIDFFNIEPIIINYKFNQNNKTFNKTNILFFGYIIEDIHIDNKEIKKIKRVTIDEITKFIPYKEIIVKIKQHIK